MNKKTRKLFSMLLTFVMVLTTALADFTPAAVTKAATQTQETQIQTSSNQYGLQENIQDGLILHCFDWKYSDIKDELPNIAAAGFTSVQTSPAQMGAGSGPWYWLYQPLGFYIGSNNGLGTKDDLQSLCTEAEKYGVKVIVDVVANHLAGDHSNIQNELKPSEYWHTFGDSIDYTNRWQVTHGDIGMKDLTTENSYVQQIVLNYINELKAVGVDGIRWDAAKHIDLPSEGSEFWKTVTNTGLYNYGEILVGPTDGHGSDNLMSEYTNYISVTDNVYGKDARESFKNGNAPSSIGNWCARGVSKNKIVYWAESHDTYSNNGEYGEDSRTANQNQVDRAYAILAAQANATTLYYSRPYATVKDQIRIGVKGSTAFKSAEVSAVNHFHNAMVGTKEYYTTGKNCSVVCRENGAVIVAGSGSNFSVEVPNGGGTTKPGTYKDEITGETWTVTSTTISGKIGSSGIAVIYDVPNPDPSVSVSNGTAGSTTKYTSDSLNVTLSLKNATKGTYSIDGAAAVEFTSDKTIDVAAGKNVGDTTTLKVTASNAEKTTDSITYTYVKAEPSSNVAYIDLPSGWSSTVYCYAYEKINGATVDNGKWPGVAMEKVSGNIYKYEADEKFTTPMVIFSDGSQQYPGSGQDGLVLEGSKIYQNGTWKEYDIVVKGTVVVKYVDEEGKEIATSTTSKGNVGDLYSTEAVSVDNYELKTTPDNATGKYVAGTTTVTYTYKAVVAPTVTSSVASGSTFTTETKTTTLTLSNATSGTYSVDNGPVKEFTDSVDVVLGQGKVADSTVTVKATATKGNETKDYTFTFTKQFNTTVDETVKTASASTTTSTASASLASQYTTNKPGVGENKTITVDGDISDWSNAMIIAQGAANDDPRVYRDNSMYEVPIDMYTLYAAYDNDNLYLMWEMTNVQDVVAPNDNYPLSQGILFQTMNVPFFIAVDTKDAATRIGNKAMTAANGTLWSTGITFEENLNKIIAVSTNGANGPYVYGGTSAGLNAKEEFTSKTSGITFKYGLGILSDKVMGLEGAYGSNNNRLVGDVSDKSKTYVDFNSLGHNSNTMDFHYEMSIPYSTLGVTASEVAENGLGVMVVATMGKSGMDCLPYDTAMNDNADQADTESQAFNSFEKSDEDNITVDFAKVGNGKIDPPEPTALELNFGADRSAPQEKGTQLTLSGIAKGGTGSYTYKYYVNNSLIETKTSASDSSTTWTPSAAGTYVIKCVVTDSTGTEKTSAKYYTVEGGVIIPTKLSVSLGLDKETITAKESVKMTATAVGGNGNITYKYQVANSGLTSYVTIADSASNTCTWKSSTAGTRYLVVTATDADGNTATDKKLLTINPIPSDISVSLALGKTTIEPKTSVGMTATVTGGTGKITYKYQVANEALTSYVTIATGTASTCTWKSSTAGKRYLVVTVTDTNGATATDKKLLTIKSATDLTASLSLASSTIEPKAAVTMTAAANGGSGTYKYTYKVWSEDLTKSVDIKALTSSNTCTWKSSTAGKRYLEVIVTDTEGNTASDKKLITIASSVNEQMSVSLSLNNATIAAKGTVTMTATAKGGDGNYKYKYEVANTSLTAFVTIGTGSSNTCTWKSSTAGKRYLVVTVTDGNGNTATSMQLLTIQ